MEARNNKIDNKCNDLAEVSARMAQFSTRKGVYGTHLVRVSLFSSNRALYTVYTPIGSPTTRSYDFLQWPVIDQCNKFAQRTITLVISFSNGYMWNVDLLRIPDVSHFFLRVQLVLVPRHTKAVRCILILHKWLILGFQTSFTASLALAASSNVQSFNCMRLLSWVNADRGNQYLPKTWLPFPN